MEHVRQGDQLEDVVDLDGVDCVAGVSADRRAEGQVRVRGDAVEDDGGQTAVHLHGLARVVERRRPPQADARRGVAILPAVAGHDAITRDAGALAVVEPVRRIEEDRLEGLPVRGDRRGGQRKQGDKKLEMPEGPAGVCMHRRLSSRCSAHRSSALPLDVTPRCTMPATPRAGARKDVSSRFRSMRQHSKAGPGGETARPRAIRPKPENFGERCLAFELIDEPGLPARSFRRRQMRWARDGAKDDSIE